MKTQAAHHIGPDWAPSHGISRIGPGRPGRPKRENLPSCSLLHSIDCDYQGMDPKVSGLGAPIISRSRVTTESGAVSRAVATRPRQQRAKENGNPTRSVYW
ncbi:hypothetical protein VTK26DRAFT_1921 [Humicola hyalothermophila]